MSTYLKQHFSTKATPQTEPIPGSTQQPNNGGGYSWKVDDRTLLDRFLILGSEGGTYYVSEKKLTKDACSAAMRLIQTDGVYVVNRVREISIAGRAPKNDPALFVLAMASVLGNEETRRYAYAYLPEVARIGTHLFHFAEYRQLFGGWGKGMRKAVAKWYTDKDIDDLAMQLVKYQQRDGWSHRDLLRLSHPKPATPEQGSLFRYVTGATNLELKGRRREMHGELPELINAIEELKTADITTAVKLITKHKLPREVMPTEMLKEKRIWEALLDHMPMTAMIRNLGTMSKIGLLVPMSEASKVVIAKIGNTAALKKSRIHPIQLLSAMLTYSSGQGVRSEATWEAVPQVVDALDGAFYTAFENIEPTGKNILLALDVSGSMNGGDVAGVPGLSPRIASSAMAMVTARTEKNYHIMAFSRGFIPLNISPRERLDDICYKTNALPFDRTDCAQPMLYAQKQGLPIDAFFIYTDSETNANSIHPKQALDSYRQKLGRAAKLAVVGMVANDVSIADPNDSGMMDVVGFDTATPAVLQDFIR